jgi:hypothetical protein
MKITNEPRTPTEAQINANRENAKKSTGPRTAEGKAASSRNRLLHGLRANKHILLDEDPEDFLLLLKDLHDRFQPVGGAEEMLVLRIASAHWRLDRAFPLEASLYRNRLQEVAEEEAGRQRSYDWQKECAELQGSPPPPAPAPSDERDRLARAFDADCVAPNSLARLARYEGSIERSIDRCLRQLKTYQAARLASPPDRPDIGPQPSPEVGQTNGSCSPPAPPAEPAVMPSENNSCHLNPKNGGVAPFISTVVAQPCIPSCAPRPNSPPRSATLSRPAPPALCGDQPRYINGHASQPDSVPPVAGCRGECRQSRYRAFEGHREQWRRRIQRHSIRRPADGRVRWQAPQPAPPWKSVRKTSEIGRTASNSRQIQFSLKMIY